MELEICANSINSAIAAQRGGADRIELCDNLNEGGTTPSAGLIQVCRNTIDIPFFILIRPRGGDFCYNAEEFEAMKQDVALCRTMGCDGVVIGILDKDGNIDMQRCAQLIDLAKPMQVTFHRAFDRCRDLEKGLEDIIALGCQRTLTTGGSLLISEAMETIKQLVAQAGKRCDIMACVDIGSENIIDIINNTAARAFHCSAQHAVRTFAGYHRENSLSAADASLDLLETSQRLVRQVKNIIINQQ